MRWLVLLLLASLFSPPDAVCRELRALEGAAIRILYEDGLDGIAGEAAGIYPETRSALEKRLNRRLVSRPTVILMKDSGVFARMAPHTMAVAFADPGRDLVVLDVGRLSVSPSGLGSILKHELCHLLLHAHVRQDLLPRWLDEGICQWVADGIADIVMDQKRSLLNRAAVNRRFIPMGALDRSFPRDPEGLTLAYEQSKAFVAYLDRRFGSNGVLGLIGRLEKGRDIRAAFEEVFGVSADELEAEWHESLRTWTAWFVHLSYYLYEILFGLTGLLSVYAFIRIMVRKRADPGEGPEESLGP